MSATNVQMALKAGSAIVMFFGLAVAAAAHPSTGVVVALFADLIFWPADGQPTLEGAPVRLLSAVGGGVMFGWGLLLWLVATRVWPLDQALAATLVRWSIMSWFVVDSCGSILAGAPLNAVVNMLFLVIFLVPIARLKA